MEWTGDALSFALAHVAAGILRIDADGTIWRCYVNRGLKKITPRRAEAVGGKGYLRIHLARPRGGLCSVGAHRVVYTHFNGPIPEGLEINHKDLNKKNNHPENLEAITPYAIDQREEVYRQDQAVNVLPWCLEHGENPLLRIAEGEYDLPGWSVYAWKAAGGYGSQGEGRGRDNAHRERIWFSPHCLGAAQQGSLF